MLDSRGTAIFLMLKMVDFVRLCLKRQFSNGHYDTYDSNQIQYMYKMSEPRGRVLSECSENKTRNRKPLSVLNLRGTLA